ncbi:MAG: HIT domain-containing protein [Parcubacteria group bacterium]|jgi:diadenosine tetraphosphate (Ap4A) HIT family hydrolase
MTDRSLWDKKNKYTEGFLKEYDHWALEVSYRQHTLGCYIIFCKRPVEKISELKTEELDDLKNVMGEIEATLSKIDIFKPDRFNYFQMGNKLNQLHFHGIPRYNSPRKFDGKEWVDETAGSAPTWSHDDVEHNLVAKLRDAIKPFLSEI